MEIIVETIFITFGFLAYIAVTSTALLLAVRGFFAVLTDIERMNETCRKRLENGN